MPTTIKLKNSVTTTNAPSSLVQGEVAINITDKKVWVGNAATTPIQLLGDGGSGSFTSIAFGAGTVSSPSITFTGDTNTGIYSPAADTIAFTEGGVESMRIDSSGNVLVGRTSVTGTNCRLNVQLAGTTASGYTAASNAGISLDAGTATNGVINLVGGGELGVYRSNSSGAFDVGIGFGDNSNRILRFDTSGSERMRIDSSGNVGIGTTPNAWSSAFKALQIAPNGQSISADGGQIIIGSNYVQESGGARYVVSAPAGAYAIGRDTHYWYTAASGTAGNALTFTERMRITSGGNVSIGTTSSGGKLTVWDGNINVNWGGGYLSSIDRGITILAGGYNDTTNKARIVHIGGVGDNNNRCGWTAYSIKTNTVNNGAEYYIRPVTWNGTAFVEQTSAGVYLTDNATSWTSASDERLKENLEPIANAVEKVKTIRAVTGKYKADTDGTSRAFLIAQDVQAVLPEAVTENSEGYLGLAYTETIPLLVAAIKEQQAMIVELTNRIKKLEGA